jgi:hypothetical protein
MLNKSKGLLVLFVAIIISSQSVVAATGINSAAVATAQEGLHKSRDSVFRMCKAEADQKQLAGVVRSAFIATCVKTTLR